MRRKIVNYTQLGIESQLTAILFVGHCLEITSLPHQENKIMGSTNGSTDFTLLVSDKNNDIIHIEYSNLCVSCVSGLWPSMETLD